MIRLEMTECHETEERYMTLQEIIDHEKDYSYNDGLQQGIQQGIVAACRDLGQTKEKTIETLRQQCNLSEEAANEYVTLFWKE